MTQVQSSKMLNRMHGDNLGQLRYVKKAEVSPRVISFNMASTAELIKKVRQGFREQRLNVDKINKGQNMVYKDLVRLQQVKRQLMRETHMYRQEDARLEILRVERERKINQVMAEYDQKSREAMEALATKKKKRRKKSTEKESVTPEPDTQSTIVKPEQDDKPETETTDEDIIPQSEFVNKDHVEDDESKPQDSDTTTEKKIERTRSSKALEVTGIIGEPKTLIKSESQEEFELRKANVDESEEQTSIGPGTLPPIRDNDDASIAVVKKVNSRARRLSLEKPGRLRLPSIYETNSNEDTDERETTMRRHSHDGDNRQSDVVISSVSVSSDDSKKYMSNKEYVKRLREKREMDNRKILDEPYQIYTEDENGMIVPMISPHKPFSNDIPSNRRRYEKDKILEKQYKRNALQRMKLNEFYERIKRPETPDFLPMILSRKKKALADKKMRAGPGLRPVAAAVLLPTHLLAEGEQPAYVRETDLDDMRAAKERGDRRSCWDNNNETETAAPPLVT